MDLVHSKHGLHLRYSQGPAIAQALAYDGPALVDVDVDPNEPPLPGKVSHEQAKKFVQAFLKGQPHRAAITTTHFKDRIRRLGD